MTTNPCPTPPIRARAAAERLRRDQLEPSRAEQSALVQGRPVAGDPGVDEQFVFVDQIQPVQLGREFALPRSSLLGSRPSRVTLIPKVKSPIVSSVRDTQRAACRLAPSARALGDMRDEARISAHLCRDSAMALSRFPGPAPNPATQYQDAVNRVGEFLRRVLERAK
jgi:hypothetical protein